MLTSILSSLGIDSTLFMQLAIYLVAYVLLYNITFKPYFLASEERRKLTSGGHDSAQRSLEMTRLAEEKYQKRARQINEEVSFLFNEQRNLAIKEAEQINKEAIAKAKDIASQAQSQVTAQLEQASSKLTQASNDVSKSIIEQILSQRGGAQ